MSSAADGGPKPVGLEALHRLKSTAPPLYLTPSPELSKSARLASEYLFSSLNPYAPKSPFNHLLVEGFDAEQIWQQIDLQAQPLLSSLRRQLRNFEKNPSEIENQFTFDGGSRKEEEIVNGGNEEKEDVESESEGLDDDDDDDEEEEEEEEEDEGEMGNEERENGNGVEDKFLKIKELEEYLVEDEAREYGLKKEKKEKNKRKRGDEDEDEEDDNDGEEEDDDELGLMLLDPHDDDDDDDMGNAKYEDFFVSKKTGRDKQGRRFGRKENLGVDVPDDKDGNPVSTFSQSDIDEPNNENDNLPNKENDNRNKRILSTHEKEQEKLRSEIEEMEKANLEPKIWTMQGEVTAAKRPKNSALEVDLDFEHNVRPAPVITEEVTASLEELIQKRILEGRFDDVKKPPTLSTKAPRENKELDENKSKKGLAELYEDEYAQKTGLVSAALSFSDEQKKEASTLFKKLCVKLDALSHFHFTPKPVIEDMSVQENVPALAMEEIAPLAVSDAAMLAPEEVFSGKGDIKEETELTKAEKKRRRAKKKRIFKAKSVKKMALQAQLTTPTDHGNGNEDSQAA